MCQSFHALTEAIAKIAVGRHLLQPLAREARQEDGKFSDAYTAVEVHVLDPRVDVPSAAPHFVDLGRLESVTRTPVFRRRVEAHVGQRLPVVDPGLTPVVGVDTRGTRSANFCGTPPFEGVGWFDDVVVDRDDRVLAFGPFGFG